MVLKIGLQPPDFELRNQHGESVSLSSYRGSRRVVLVFYPYAFSRVCSSELHALRDRLPEFANERTQLLAVSCDHMFSLRGFADRDGLGFPLLSDFWPHGAVSQLYGVFDPQRGCANRGTFILDTSGLLIGASSMRIPDARWIEDYKPCLPVCEITVPICPFRSHRAADGVEWSQSRPSGAPDPGGRALDRVPRGV